MSREYVLKTEIIFPRYLLNYQHNFMPIA